MPSRRGRAATFTRAEISPELFRAKRSAVERFLKGSRAGESPQAFAASSKPEQNVVGVGVGQKLVGGKPTGTLSIRIYVVSKLPPRVIPKKSLLPEKVGAVPVDVIEVGRLRKFAPPTEQRRHRPARPGCSVGFAFPPPKDGFVMAGTFGALATADGTRYILSNNHVLADEGKLKLGSPIFQPGLLDGGNANKDAIAKLTRFIPLSKTKPNQVDCAIAAVSAGAKVGATPMSKVGRLAAPEPIDAVPGMKVHKVGRTTGYTTGVIQDVSADVTVGYDIGAVTFQDQILIVGDGGESFSDSGDSGSMIVARATRRPTGLLFAGSASHTIANHMQDVLDALAVDIVR
jgi:hypothetical protein